MNKINKKYKIYILIAIGIVALIICYYAYAKEDSSSMEELDTNVTEENNEVTNIKEEKATIKVHISGAVKNPGLIDLEEDARIADAIDKAGGLTEDACMDEVNLAYKLEDGIKIKIPTIKEVEEQKKSGESLLASATSTNEQENQNSSTKNNLLTSKKVNINTATQEELESLPGVGESTALKIINHRKENGKFKTIEDIKQVSGIGDSKYNKLKDFITV